MTNAELKNREDSTNETAGPRGKREIIIGIAEIEKYLKRGGMQTHDLIMKCGLPAEKNQAAVWTLDVEKFKAWCKEMQWDPWRDGDKALARKVYKKMLAAAGPGFLIKGDLGQLGNKLGFSPVTLMEFQRIAGCPIEKLEGNQYRVHENEWILFMMEHGPRRKQERDVSWAQ